MNKNEIAFVDNLIATLTIWLSRHACPVCSEMITELKLLQSGKVTSRQVRLTCLND